MRKHKNNILIIAVAAAVVSTAVLRAQDEPAQPQEVSGEEQYERLLKMQRSLDAAVLFAKLSDAARDYNYENAEALEFTGNLRRLDVHTDAGIAVRGLYLVRSLDDDIYILSIPEDASALAAESDSPYAGIADKIKNKMKFNVRAGTATVDGELWHFARLESVPERGFIDRLFFIFIVLMLFFVMMGMGMTLTVRDFAMVAIKPRAMIVGPLCQFGLLPFLAYLLGSAAGYPESYPFIFIGLILVSASPGGVTSNLMTYWAKGDLALSVSMTGVSTILSLVFTPLLLQLYAAGVPNVEIPVKDVIVQILVLVIVPLLVGLGIRARFENFAKASEKYFSGLGVFALLFLIITGILNNLHHFLDFDRYGLSFYAVVLTLTLSAMVFSLVVAKILRVDNFQTRAIALETGLQNAALAMTIAILLQDRMGDFHSSMFAVSGLFGLWMYVAGTIMITLFPKILPVDLHFHVKDVR